MKARFAIALVLLGFWAAGCTDDNPSDDSGTDAGVETGSDVGGDASVDVIDDTTSEVPPDAGTDGECNSLSNIGTVVNQLYVATEPVTGDGGVIATGTYVLTAAAVYSGVDGGSGPTGTALADTLLVLDGYGYQRVASIVVDDAGIDGGPLRQNGTFELKGSGIHVKQTCPPGSQPFTSYDSDGKKLHIYAPALGPLSPGVMFEYTRQ